MLDTTLIKIGGDNLPKTLQPGNVTCTITNIRVEPFKFKEGTDHIILSLVGPDLPNFEGFFIDKNNEGLGKYKGQVGEVKTTRWSYADGVTPSGVVIKKDDEMLKFLMHLCKALDLNTWVGEQTGKYENVTALIEGFNKSKVYKDIPLNFCIGGNEYKNKSGYTAYELFLPKWSKEGAAFGKGKVVTFNEEKHITRKKVDTVSEFESEDTGLTDTQEFKL